MNVSKMHFLIKKTTEFIKITNINYHLDYYSKAKFYLNKYYTTDNGISYFLCLNNY